MFLLAALLLGGDDDGDDDSDDDKDGHHDANDDEEQLLVLPPEGLLQALALLLELACVVLQLIWKRGTHTHNKHIERGDQH